MTIEFRLPDIGEGIAEGEIVRWLVEVGDRVEEFQPLVEVMTDKVTAEIPSPCAGVVQTLRAKAGDTVKVGSVLVVFDTLREEASEAKIVARVENGKHHPAETPAAVKISVGAVASPVAYSPLMKVLAAPATRKLARQLGVNLSLVRGSGPRGRVTPEDVREFMSKQSQISASPVASASGTMTAVSPSSLLYESAGDKRVPFSGVRKKIGEHLVLSKHTAPHFSYVEEADMTEMVRLRQSLQSHAESQGVKLTYLPFMMKAVVEALKAYPMLNASLDESAQEIVYKQDFHFGVAVATEQGLIVPVVKHVNHKNVLTLAQEIKGLSEKARNGQLGLDDLRGGTFTLTSIGSVGGLFSVPIINYPEVAIIGINKISRRPVVRQVNDEETVMIRDMMYVSISCDHRVVDGYEAALFVKRLVEFLENPALLMLSL